MVFSLFDVVASLCRFVVAFVVRARACAAYVSSVYLLLRAASDFICVAA